MQRLLALLLVLLAPALALAQTAATGSTDALTYADAATELVQLLQTLKGAGAIGITLAVVQGIMLALRTPLADKLGKYRLTALLGLSCATSLLTAKLAGASWGAAVLSGPLIAAAQVFAHQLYTQFTEKA